MEWLLIIPLLFVLAILFEFRARKPDQIVLYESRGEILRRASRYYPRHFSLSIPSTVQSLFIEVHTEAKGQVGLIVRLTVATAADLQHLEQLIRIGGWNPLAVERATEDLQVVIQALMRELTSQYEVESIASAELTRQLEEKLRVFGKRLGLDVISVNIQSIDPTDPEIVDTLREREAARIRERTEKVNQEARVAAAKARVEADATIALVEHELELKRLSLQREQEVQQAQLERIRVQEELDRRKMQLEMDRAEVELVAQNPQLLILTPQVARLAEASQSLRNARTVVSLSGEELPEGSSILQTLLSLLRGGASTGELTQKPGKLESK